jgi:hypothetical protein
MGPCFRRDDARGFKFPNSTVWRSRGAIRQQQPSLRAKRSNPSHRTKKEWIASSQVLLAMTLIDRSPRSRGAIRPRFAEMFHALEIRGRGECRMRAAPAVPCANGRRKRTRAYRFSGGTPTFPAQWLYGLLRTLPGDQDLFVTVAPRMMAGLTPGWAGFASAGLDANLEASGPHDFAVRSSTVRQRAV